MLVNDEFSIVGLIDLDGVMAATGDMVAQFPFDMGLNRPIPGRAESGEFALKRLERLDILLPQYLNGVAEQETKLG